MSESSLKYSKILAANVSPEKNKSLNSLPHTHLENETKRKGTFLEKMKTLKEFSNQNSVIQTLREYLDNISFKEEEEAFDCLVYGMKVKQIQKNGEQIVQTIFVSDNIITDLVLVDQKNEKYIRRDLTTIQEISFGEARGNFIKIKERKKTVANLHNNLCVTLHFVKAESIDFLFYSQATLNYFISGLLSILKTESEETENLNKPNIQIRKLWTMYDRDHSGKMELEEFQKFFKAMNIDNTNVNSNEDKIVALFRNIDKDNSGKIDLDEFILFYKDLTSGKEFEELFSKYSKGKEKMYLQDLINYMKNEQKEPLFSHEEAARLILENKKEIINEINTKSK